MELWYNSLQQQLQNTHTTYQALKQFAKYRQDDVFILHLTARVLNGMYGQFSWQTLFITRAGSPAMTDSQ